MQASTRRSGRAAAALLERAPLNSATAASSPSLSRAPARTSTRRAAAGGARAALRLEPEPRAPSHARLGELAMRCVNVAAEFALDPRVRDAAPAERLAAQRARARPRGSARLDARDDAPREERAELVGVAAHVQERRAPGAPHGLSAAVGR